MSERDAPQEEGSENHEGGGVTLHLHGAAALVESAETRALDERTPESSNTASHVDDARSGEIDGSGVEERSRVEGGQPAGLQGGRREGGRVEGQQENEL